jgi:nucleotide-binding universal stress UspA family protein
MKVEFRRILCATDLSDLSNQAVYYGASLAARFEAVLVLCHVIDLPVVSVHGAAYVYPHDYVEGLKVDAQQKLQDLMRDRAASWKPVVIAGPVASTLCNLAGTEKADLVIAATHGRSGLKRWILGSVTERLIRTVPCPLMSITPFAGKPETAVPAPVEFKNILVGCDFSVDSGAALESAISLAQEYQARLHLVHVIEPVAYREVMLAQGVLDEMRENLNTKRTGQLKAMVPDGVDNWCEVKTNCLAGKPYEELIKYATIHAVDLIVLGIRGRGLVDTMLLGATTDRVVRKSPCPVLAVGPKPGGMTEEIPSSAAEESA